MTAQPRLARSHALPLPARAHRGLHPAVKLSQGSRTPPLPTRAGRTATTHRRGSSAWEPRATAPGSSSPRPAPSRRRGSSVGGVARRRSQQELAAPAPARRRGSSAGEPPLLAVARRAHVRARPHSRAGKLCQGAADRPHCLTLPSRPQPRTRSCRHRARRRSARGRRTSRGIGGHLLSFVATNLK